MAVASSLHLCKCLPTLVASLPHALAPAHVSTNEARLVDDDATLEVVIVTSEPALDSLLADVFASTDEYKSSTIHSCLFTHPPHHIHHHLLLLLRILPSNRFVSLFKSCLYHLFLTFSSIVPIFVELLPG